MRLLHKTTLELSWHLPSNIPPYIVLSHRWRGTETSLQSFLAERRLPAEQRSTGTNKILRLCEEIASHSVDFVWIDTCCINKESSTELQEAINSMYRWYERATLCLVYIDDVDLSDTARGDANQQLAASEWFTRGWTLQELLAPAHEDFLDVNWTRLGSRHSLADVIQTRAGIRPACFGNRQEILAATVAERMSWMSGRQTTRVEDVAYCLLGLFDVNMGMLYGEGPKAFGRLQREIINEIDDETLYLWLPTADMEGMETVSMLAPNPECFAVCRKHDIRCKDFFAREPSRKTVKGLRIETYSQRQEQFQSTQHRLLLNCTVDGGAAWVKVQRQDPRDAKWRRLAVAKFVTSAKDDDPEAPSVTREYQTATNQIMRAGMPTPGGMEQHWGVKLMRFNSEVTRYSIFVE